MSRLVISEAGGGVFGIGPARWLSFLEASISVGAIFEKTAVFTGTSIGAVDVALLATGMSAKDLYKLHVAEQAGIFGSKRFLWQLRGGARYDDSYVNKLLQSKLGDRTCADTLRPLYLTAWDYRKRSLRVFGPKDKGVPLWKAVRCSMAAPTYFSTVDGRYGDGGLAANVPTIVGLANAFLDGYVGADARTLTLVTSGNTPEGGEVNPNASVTTQLQDEVLPAITSGNSADVTLIMQFISKLTSSLGAGILDLRIQPDCPDWEMDAVDKAGDIAGIWETDFQKNKLAATAFVLMANS